MNISANHIKKITLFLLLSTVLFTNCSKEKRSDKAAEKMRQFVIDIGEYARETDPNFILIPQNGEELGLVDMDKSYGVNSVYLNAIDGFGVEEIHYNGDYSPDDYRIENLRVLAQEKPVLVSEYITNNQNEANAYERNSAENWLSFVRTSGNYDYNEIPDTIPNENNNDIIELSDAKNYLYLISTENYSDKGDFLDAIAATNYDVVLIDLFFGDEELTGSDINRIKQKANGGQRLVISYISIGSAEKYRYYWKRGWGHHHPLFLKRKYDGYPDEFWVKFWRPQWQEIIYGNDESYIKKILNAGFDGAYLDNIEAFYFLYYKS
ncbi:MAG: endo alpha-1,4 polygalactosaminidase [Flavobacteriales bacterium]